MAGPKRAEQQPATSSGADSRVATGRSHELGPITVVEVLVSGPKDYEGGEVALGHVAIRLGKRIYEAGRYAGTYKEEAASAVPDFLKGIAAKVGWAFGAAILLDRDPDLYLQEENRRRNVRGYTMDADRSNLASMRNHMNQTISRAADITDAVRDSSHKDYGYLRKILRADRSARVHQLPANYKLIGNSCLDLVAETLDAGYWVWDFDNLTILDPYDLSKKLEENHKYSTARKTYGYRGGAKDPAWWFAIDEDGKTVLDKGAAKTPTVTK